MPATPGPSAGPPPPPPPAIQAPDDAPANKDEAGRNNLLSALSKGANVTQGSVSSGSSRCWDDLDYQWITYRLLVR